MKTKLFLFAVLFATFFVSQAQTVTMAIVGEAVGGWPPDPQPANYSDPRQMASTDNTNYSIQNLVVTTATSGGGAKFRSNNSWTSNWGNATFPSGTATLNGSNISTVAGTYNVTFNRVSGQYLFSAAMGLDDFSKSNYTIFPNPTQNEWRFVSSNDEIQSVEVSDINGKIVKRTAANALELNLDASSLPAGIYFAKVNSVSGTQNIKVLKN